MTDHEKTWDTSLRIQTCGRDELGADAYHHPYEPTPYSVLEQLAESKYILRENIVIDHSRTKKNAVK